MLGPPPTGPRLPLQQERHVEEAEQGPRFRQASEHFRHAVTAAEGGHATVPELHAGRHRGLLAQQALLFTGQTGENTPPPPAPCTSAHGTSSLLLRLIA